MVIECVCQAHGIVCVVMIVCLHVLTYCMCNFNPLLTTPGGSASTSRSRFAQLFSVWTGTPTTSYWRLAALISRLASTRPTSRRSRISQKQPSGARRCRSEQWWLSYPTTDSSSSEWGRWEEGVRREWEGGSGTNQPTEWVTSEWLRSIQHYMYLQF